jgi:hypothetical protein
MVETSYYFDGTTVGDATLAPYSAARYTTNWKNILTVEDNHGIINDHLDELLVSGIAGGVIVSTGAALVEGYFYENDAEVTVAIPTPVTDPRIDRIVLRKDAILQTVRITRIAGTENPAPTAPAITQTAGGIWDIPLAQVLINVAGAITVTDERERTLTPLIPTVPPAQVEIETITADGSSSTMDFQDIPQTFRHLRLIGALRASVSPSVGSIWLNGDTVATNYWLQWFSTDPTPAFGIGAANTRMIFLARSAAQIANEPIGGFSIVIPHYVGGFYKMITSSYGLANSGATQFNLEFQGSIWLNTDAITRISLPISLGVYEAGSQMTLYGEL